jgi:hypothetical protein
MTPEVVCPVHATNRIIQGNEYRRKERKDEEGKEPVKRGTSLEFRAESS